MLTLKIILQLNLFFLFSVRGAIVMTQRHNHHVSVGAVFYKSSIILYQDKMKMRIIVCTLAIFSITAIEIKSRTTEDWIVWKKSPHNMKWTENVIYWRHLVIYNEDSLNSTVHRRAGKDIIHWRPRWLKMFKWWTYFTIMYTIM